MRSLLAAALLLLPLAAEAKKKPPPAPVATDPCSRAKADMAEAQKDFETAAATVEKKEALLKKCEGAKKKKSCDRESLAVEEAAKLKGSRMESFKVLSSKQITVCASARK